MSTPRWPEAIVAWESPNGDRRWSDKDPLTRAPAVAYVSYMRYATLAREYAELRDRVEEALKEAAREPTLVKLPKGYCTL